MTARQPEASSTRQDLHAPIAVRIFEQAYTAKAFVASLIPFGPIFIDPTLRHAMEEAQARGSEEVATDAR